MADNNHDNDLQRRMEVQEQTSKAQQAALDKLSANVGITPKQPKQ